MQVLSATGHVRLVDFGFCKASNTAGFLFNKVGTAHYLAPEMLDKQVKTRGYTKAVDFWALGCLLYEMVVGKVCVQAAWCVKCVALTHAPRGVQAAFGSPHDSPYQVYTRIVQSKKVSLPRSLPAPVKSLIHALLSPNPALRLGSVNAVKHHEFFAGINWESVQDQRLVPPFNPNVSHVGDASQFDDYSVSSGDTGPPLTRAELAQFDSLF